MPTVHPETAPRTRLPRSLHFALFAIGLLWLLAARVGADSAAQGISHAVRTDAVRPVLYSLFLLILLPTGFTALNWLALRNGSLRSTNALPTRPTMRAEWQRGAALGWGLLLLAVLPMVATGALHPQFWFAPRAWGLLLLSLLALLLGSLATEIAFRGFLFKRLIDAIGPASATLVLTAIFALSATSRVNTTPYSFFVSLLSGFLFSLAYLRTHALWLGWGLRFGWLASMGVLFGLPLAGSVDFANVVATESTGGLWLTGGTYGPEGALLTAGVLLVGVALLYRATREYAWQYTHPVIVSGGYPMDVAPPAAHAAMEAAVTPAPLVQILSTTATGISSHPTIVSAFSPGSPRDGERPDDGEPSRAAVRQEPGEPLL